VEVESADRHPALRHVEARQPVRRLRGHHVALEERVDDVVLVSPVRLTGEPLRERAECVQPFVRGVDVGLFAGQLVDGPPPDRCSGSGDDGPSGPLAATDVHGVQ
jgi:hypothetical protein